MTVTVIVLDSVGVGALPDAAAFGDTGAHTLDHTLQHTRVTLPNFVQLGLGCIDTVTSLACAARPLASYGKLAERSPGKDTTTGHWEFMGVILSHPFKSFPPEYPSFPKAVMTAFDAATGRSHLGNKAASGTVILDELGAAHLKTGNPIVYTSADSVFQIAAHVEVVPLETLYHWCEAAREILQGEHAVARVIARPFTGKPGAFTRLGDKRKDYSLSPPEPTVLNTLKAAGKQVIGIGKIPDIYNHQGFTEEIHSSSNDDGVTQTLKVMARRPDGLIFCNLVEFDSLYGHRRDPAGYAHALAAVDDRLPELLSAVHDDDVLLFVSDHGNDPTFPGTDHTREYGLLLTYRPNHPAQSLGTRSSFADVGATVAALLHVPWSGKGQTFLV
jgi:phosphopentomutase